MPEFEEIHEGARGEELEHEVLAELAVGGAFFGEPPARVLELRKGQCQGRREVFVGVLVAHEAAWFREERPRRPGIRTKVLVEIDEGVVLEARQVDVAEGLLPA